MLKHLLKPLFLSIRLINKTALAFTLCALLITISCGKRKPPLPPVESVSQRVEINGFQRGGQIILSWRMPARNASEGNVLSINRADIYRLVEAADSPLTLTEEEFASRSTLIGNLQISNSDFALQRLTYTDTLEFAAQPVRIRYAIRFVNNSGQKAAFSNFLLIDPSANVAGNPEALSASVSQDGVLLKWQAPRANINGSVPVNILGYNLYRSDSKNDTAKLLNAAPVSDTNYSDNLFEFNKEYFYFVRSVSVGGGGEPVESLESNIVRITPVDAFPPSAPGAITIAAAPLNLSIFFATNPEKDIAGYRIYRSTDPNLSKSVWTLLTKELLTANTFQDTNVETGKTYYYYLTAVDTAGNISEPSEIVSETLP
ncbi:MAG: Fibronectin type protein [Acidobacteria bacterium]|jgi:hypothetical protein|nr:Fibronectin type protein [Acidobacteriota bacterium]